MARNIVPPPSRVPWDWRGKTCYIILGGTSVVPEQVQRLRGRPRTRTIVVNSSYLIAHWADLLFFGDDRWYKREVQERTALIRSFAGEVWTVAAHTAAREPGLKLLRQLVPGENGCGGLSTERDAVAMQRTSLSGAINLAVLRGADRIVLVGADNRDGADGRVHHHDEYPWVRRRSTWLVKQRQLALAAEALKRLDIPVINASPISTLPWWPICDFKAHLDEEDANARA